MKIFYPHPTSNTTTAENFIAPIKMGSHTLEGLPYEMIALILCKISSFGDLHALINASVVYYKIFAELPGRILECVAENILGAAWRDAAAVLIHQRNGFLPGLDPDYIGVKQGLSKEILLERGDISNILANQRFFKSCAKNFPIPDRSDSTSSVTPRSGLSIKYFYQIWLLSLRFGYEDIETFARRPPLSQQQLADLQLLTRFILRSSHFRRRVCLPRWKNYCVSPYFLGGMFWQLANKDDVRILKFTATAKHNILLQLKMISHMVAAIDIGAPRNLPGLRSRIVGLRIDYSNPNMTVRDLVDKYELSCGWE